MNKLYKLSSQPKYSKYSVLDFPSKYFDTEKQLLKYCKENINSTSYQYYCVSLIDVDTEEIKYELNLYDFFL